MKDQRDIAERPLAGGRIGQISALDLDTQPLQEPGPAPRTDQGPDPVAPVNQLLGDVAAQQPGRPRDEDLTARLVEAHEIPSYRRAP